MPLKSGQSLSNDWRTINRHGSQGSFHKKEIISTRDAIETRRPRILLGGGGGGIKWQKPKELDPTKSVPKDTLVYISPQNTLVTDGMTDLVTDATVISCEGVWQAAKAVPAASGGKYNVPVFPYPSGMGVDAPSGSPLKGDLDDDSIFWIYWGQVAC